MGTNIIQAGLLYTDSRRATGVIVRRTAQNERYVLTAFGTMMGKRTLQRIGVRDVERWAAAQLGRAPGTRRARFVIMHSFFDWCVERGLLRRSPMATLKAPKVPRGVHRDLDRTQARLLFACCRDDRDRLILQLGLQQGLRRAEIAGLEVGDVSFSAEEIRVTGKGGHVRIVSLTGPTLRTVRKYLSARPTITAGPLIRSDHPRFRHQHVSPEWVGIQVRRLATDAGVKRAPFDGVGTHSLRHTALSDIYEQHGNVEVVREIAGHQSLATTQIYLRSSTPAKLRAAMEGRDYELTEREAG